MESSQVAQHQNHSKLYDLFFTVYFGYRDAELSRPDQNGDTSAKEARRKWTKILYYVQVTVVVIWVKFGLFLLLAMLYPESHFIAQLAGVYHVLDDFSPRLSRGISNAAFCASLIFLKNDLKLGMCLNKVHVYGLPAGYDCVMRVFSDAMKTSKMLRVL